jgi:hypothetical protein
LATAVWALLFVGVVVEVVVVAIVFVVVFVTDTVVSTTALAQIALVPAGPAQAFDVTGAVAVGRVAPRVEVAVAVALGVELATAFRAQERVVPAGLAATVLDGRLFPAVVTGQLHLGSIQLGLAGVLVGLTCAAGLVELVRVGQNREVAAAAVLAEPRVVVLLVDDELPEGVVQLAVLQRRSAEALQVPREADAGLLQPNEVEEFEAEQVQGVHGWAPWVGPKRTEVVMNNKSTSWLMHLVLTTVPKESITESY